MTKTTPTRTAAQVRREFIEFFRKQHEHAFAESSPVVPHADPTLLFTNAGMNQFKDVFLGQGDRPYTRAVNSQKCIRAGGKHNDLEDVGKDTYHQTFFEMLGNWSFGDYFKAEAIEWAWTLLTEEWGLDPERLHVTVFEGNEAEGLEPDLEAEALWKRFVSPERISRWGRKDNFWEMGESGPCGPCSEIHYDFTPDLSGADKVNADDPRVVELWNLVFIQFNRGEDGRLTPLPAQHVDTGMGLERVVSVLQHVNSNYDTDLWSGLFRAIESHTGAHPYGGVLDDPVDIAYRVIADHVRCLTVAITDGAMPSNEGRGYVLRRILRRAVRHAHQTLGVEGPLLCDLVPAVVDSLGEAFPELTRNPEHAAQIIRDEEESFLKTLDRGIALFDQAAARAGDGQGISAEDAFQLHDTFGFPIDLTRVMAEERSLSVDENGYERLMEKARERSRQGGDTQRAIGLPADALAQLKFRSVTASDDIDKYHGRPITATVRAIWNGRDFDNNVDTTERGREYGIVTDRTNFYAEQGGQVGDTGKLRDNDADHSEFTIADTRTFGGYVLHVGEIVRGNIRVGESVQLAIDRERREQIKANHTATHLLNLALRQVLGSDVQQKGSLVAPDRLRFDFSFTHAMSLDQIAEAERIVNEHITESMPVHASLVPLEKAQEINGVRAVFGERYPDPVRVVSVGVGVDRLLSDPGSAEWMGYTVEFCGGTHLETTDGARRLVIVHEQSPASGVRRITAVTGAAALAAEEAAQDIESRLIHAAQTEDDSVVQQFDHAASLIEELTVGAVSRHRLQTGLIDPLRDRVRTLRKKTQKAARQDVVNQAHRLTEDHSGPIVVHRIDGADTDTLRSAMDVIRARMPETAAMLFTADEDEAKVTIVASVPKPLIARGLKAGDWVREAAKTCGGGGGGRPDMAQAGGKQPEKIEDAMRVARDVAAKALSEEGN